MNTITIKKLDLLKSVIVNSLNTNLPRIKLIATRVIICIVIVDIILFLFIYKKFFSPLSIVESASISSFYAPLLGKVGYSAQLQADIGTQTKEFMIILENEKFLPKVVSIIIKPEFTVSGNIITINNDNISVFEYENIDIAKAEAISYVNKYDKSTKPYIWKEFTYIYTKDNLIIFYLGSREEIINSLIKFAGKSLM
jgi:hypothetical protein